MSMQFAYNYAFIDDTGMCYDFLSTSAPQTDDDPYRIEVPVNDPEYLLKYYINGAWYEDAAGTIPWTSSLL